MINAESRRACQDTGGGETNGHVLKLRIDRASAAKPVAQRLVAASGRRQRRPKARLYRDRVRRPIMLRDAHVSGRRFGRRAAARRWRLAP